VITAYLVGDEQLLERLRALPDAINSGLLAASPSLGSTSNAMSGKTS